MFLSFIKVLQKKKKKKIVGRIKPESYLSYSLSIIHQFINEPSLTGKTQKATTTKTQIEVSLLFLLHTVMILMAVAQNSNTHTVYKGKRRPL